MNPVGRFHVSNFGGVINIQMNLEFACQLSCLINDVKEERGEILPTLASLVTKIEKQFEYMGKFTIN